MEACCVDGSIYCMLAGGSFMEEGVRRMMNVVECFQDQSVL